MHNLRQRHTPDTKRRIFLPALSIDTAAMATENSRTRPTRAASYSGFCNSKSGGEAEVGDLLQNRLQGRGLGSAWDVADITGLHQGLTRMTAVFLNIGCRYTRTQVTPESCCRNLIPTAIRMGL